MVSFISSLEINNTVALDTNIFLWMATSVADVAAVNPNAINGLLATDLIHFLLKAMQCLVMILKIHLKILEN